MVKIHDVFFETGHYSAFEPARRIHLKIDVLFVPKQFVDGNGALLADWLRGKLTCKRFGEALRQTMGACGQLIWLTFGSTALIVV